MNVSEGDMAELIQSPRGTNIGAICKVLQYHGYYEYFDSGLTMHIWRVRFAYPVARREHDSPTGIISKVAPGTEVCVPDPWLRRIKPLPCEEMLEEVEATKVDDKVEEIA